MHLINKLFSVGGENQSFFDKMSFAILFVTIFLLPFFFLPSSLFLFGFSKIILLSLGVILSLIFWLVARLKQGTFELPKHLIFIFALAVPLVYLLSSIFSDAIKISLFGRGFELDTFSTVTLLFLLFILVPILFKTKQRLTYLYTAFFVSSAIVALFQILRLIFGVNFLSLGVFGSATSNLIGKWNDLSVFFGLVSIFSLTALELLKVSKPLKIFLCVMLAISVVFLAIINFTIVWTVLGLFSLIFFIYTLLFKNKGLAENSADKMAAENKRFSVPSFVIFIISLIFVVSGGLFTDTITTFFGTSQIEARPSWGATFDVAKYTLKENPILGAGPNRFVNQWLMHKPEGINSTIFWNIDFNTGIGLVPSAIVTTGILGILAWLLFLGSFVLLAFKGILNSAEDILTKFIAMSSFLASLFLWIFAILYTPNLVIMSLAMVFTGVFVAYLEQENIIKKINLSFSVNPRMGFIAISVIVILLAASISLGVVASKDFVASVFFQRGLTAFNINGDINSLKSNVAKAIKFGESDVYYRTLSQINLLELNAIVSQKDVSADKMREQFQTTLGSAIENAVNSMKKDETNYQNWVSLGGVYEAVVPLKIDKAYESAMVAYQQAAKFNPASPELDLIMARLELAKGDNKKAREFIASSLQKKNNYTEAVFLLSQIEVNEGNIPAAISSVEAASMLAPNDPVVFFQLGLLKYNNKDYKGAVPELERAILLSPNYANAKYFLGLSYNKTGRRSDALKQFEDIKVFNPDNKEIQTIIKNLKDGKDPFADVNPPAKEPETRKELPIEE